jgi:hypothetical protein
VPPEDRHIVLIRRKNCLRDSNEGGSPNSMTMLDLREAHFVNGHCGAAEASSKGCEVSRERGVPGVSRNWLGVRDDFRNWLVTAA